MGTRYLIPALAAAVGCALFACDAPATGRHEYAIVGGKAAAPDEFPELALVYNRTSGRICSGTLVAADAVLTAAHCLDGATNAALEISVYFDTIDMRFPGQTIEVRGAIIHPDYAKGGATSLFDIAILELATPLTDRRTAAISAEPAMVGEQFLQVGFGRTDPANEASYGQLHFYSEASAACAPYQLAESQYICFRQEDGDGVCDGDSGGPIFRASEGGRTMVGLVSFGRGDSCRALGVGLQVATHHAFLKQHLGLRMACAQDGVCDNSCDEQGTLDLDCQVCEAVTDCKQGDFCIAGDCTPPKNAARADAARGGTALGSGCDAAGRSGDTATWVLMLTALALALRRARRVTAGRVHAS